MDVTHSSHATSKNELTYDDLRQKSHRVCVGDYSFHLVTVGDTTADGPPLLLLHGFMGCCEDWLDVMVGLGDRHRCIAVDLPGHGQTQVLDEAADPHHPPFEMAPTAHALIAMLDALEIPVCALLGYSMGGRLALYLAIHYPNRIRRLVLESASPGLATESERQARRQKDEHLAQRLETDDFEDFLTQWYQQPLFARLHQHHNFGALLQRRLRNYPAALARSLRQLGTGQQPSLWTAIQHHTHPTLVLVGEFDTKFRAIATQMCDHCAAMTSVVIPDCGHTVHAEQPTLFASRIKAFLTRAD